jgi:hypothetical protein
LKRERALEHFTEERPPRYRTVPVPDFVRPSRSVLARRA